MSSTAIKYLREFSSYIIKFLSLKALPKYCNNNVRHHLSGYKWKKLKPVKFFYFTEADDKHMWALLPYLSPFSCFSFYVCFLFLTKTIQRFFPIFAHNQNRMVHDLFEAMARHSACVNLLTNVRSSIILGHFKIIYNSNFFEEEIYPQTLR